MITENNQEVFINAFEYKYINKFEKESKNPITLICDLIYVKGQKDKFIGIYQDCCLDDAFLTNAYVKGAEDINLIDIIDESIIDDIEGKARIYQRGY